MTPPQGKAETKAESTTEAPTNDKPEQSLIDAADGAGESGGQKIADSQRAEVASVVQTEPAAASDGGATVLDGSSEVDEKLIEVGEATHVTLTGDVFEKFYFPDTKRPSFRIKWHAGQVVPVAAINAYNERVKANAERASRSDEVVLSDHIDATTIASGTGANSK